MGLRLTAALTRGVVRLFGLLVKIGDTARRVHRDDPRAQREVREQRHPSSRMLHPRHWRG